MVNKFMGILTKGIRFMMNSKIQPMIMCKIIFTPNFRAFTSIPIPKITSISIIIPNTIKLADVVLKPLICCYSLQILL